MRFANLYEAAALAAAAFLAHPAAAQPGGPPPGEPVVIHAGRVFDSERGTFLGARDILLRGSRIEAIGENLAVPAGAREIDLRAYTVLPGLIDAHTHLLMETSPKLDEGHEMAREVAFEGTPLLPELGPVYFVGAAKGAQVIKIYAENTPNRATFSMDEMRAIVDEARRTGLTVAAHATEDAAVWRAVEAGVNTVEHGYQVSDSTFAFMARRGVALVPTDPDRELVQRYVAVMDMDPAPTPEEQEQFLEDRSRDRLRRAQAAGVTIVAGSDAYHALGGERAEWARRTLWGYRDAGMSPAQVLQSATIHAARAMGQGERLGTLRPGAWADIIAVEGDPATDFDAMERVRFVMKDGKVYVGEGVR